MMLPAPATSAGPHGPQRRPLDRSKYGGVEIARQDARIIGWGGHRLLVAERASGLKMRVLAFDRTCRPSASIELGLERAEKVDAIYREADFITVHLPKNADTLGFVDDRPSPR